jgi:membrane protease YdiL (CAAX protease family)
LNRGGFGRRFLFPMDEQPLPIPPGEKARAVDRWLAPFLIFGLLYIAASVAILGGAMHYGVTATQWLALSAAVVATALCIVIFDRGRWPIGFSGPPLAAVRELLFGCLVAAMLIGFADFLVALMANLHHTRGNGFPWTELIAVYIPAAIHEELLFRGYAYQKMRRWSRVTAIVVLSLLFAVAHMGNRGVTVIAFTNLAIAGVLLALAYELYTRLWLPIGLHLMWNPTVLITQVSGPPAITGGAFGLEGSIAVTIAELLAIGWLLSRMYHSPAKKQEIP